MDVLWRPVIIYIPLKEKRIKSNWFPGISDECVEAINQRGKLLKEFGDPKNHATWDQYTRARNHVTNLLIRRTKKRYFTDTIEEHREKPKVLWTHFETPDSQKKGQPASRVLMGELKPRSLKTWPMHSMTSYIWLNQTTCILRTTGRLHTTNTQTARQWYTRDTRKYIDLTLSLNK